MNAERTTHTPGPWTFEEGSAERQAMSNVFKAADREFQIAYVTCESRNPYQRAEDIANARLIASAPDLLAACKAALARIEQNDSSYGSQSTINQLRAAIATAEGDAT